METGWGCGHVVPPYHTRLGLELLPIREISCGPELPQEGRGGKKSLGKGKEKLDTEESSIQRNTQARGIMGTTPPLKCDLIFFWWVEKG